MSPHPSDLKITLRSSQSNGDGAEPAAASDSMFLDVFEYASDGVFILDVTPEGRYLIAAFNPAEEKLVGLSNAEVVGRHVDDVLPREVADALLANYRSCVSAGQLLRYSEELELPSGRRCFCTTLIPVKDAAGVVRRIIGVARDVTEQIEAEQKLRKSEQQLHQAQKMEAMGRLTAGIAHDFNNIVAVILSSSTFLLESLGVADPRREDAEHIKCAAERAAELTRQLLAFSRKQELTLLPLDINKMVIGISKLLGRLLGENIQLTMSLAPDLGQAMADLGQLEQVIINLAVNARDAMPGGGTIHVETANVELSGAESACGRSGPHVLLSVSDTGIGMEPSLIQRIFEPFFTTKPAGTGTGLGLSTCYGIVKQCGGHIAVNSKPGEGSVFKVLLPRVSNARLAANDDQEQPLLRGRNERILLVEDDEAVRASAKKILEQCGYRVLAAPDGAQALALFEQLHRRLDLVLADVGLPGMSGPKLVEEIRKRQPMIKVLFMSGHIDPAQVGAEDWRRAAELIRKPFPPEALARRVREVLEGRGARA